MCFYSRDKFDGWCWVLSFFVSLLHLYGVTLLVLLRQLHDFVVSPGCKLQYSPTQWILYNAMSSSCYNVMIQFQHKNDNAVLNTSYWAMHKIQTCHNTLPSSIHATCHNALCSTQTTYFYSLLNYHTHVLQTLICCLFLVFTLPLPPVDLVLWPMQSGTYFHLAFITLPLPIPSIIFLNLTAPSRPLAPLPAHPSASDSATGWHCALKIHLLTLINNVLCNDLSQWPGSVSCCSSYCSVLVSI